MDKISIIIPTLNEAENISMNLAYLSEIAGDAELIVADANSSDNTIGAVGKMAQVIFSKRGRGAQMNAGAKVACGDVLWFIHADCRPHPESVPAMFAALKDQNIAGGAFEYNLNHKGLFYRLVEFNSNLKNHIFKKIFGDMGIFVRKTVFLKMNGFKDIPLMEDVDFCRRLKKMGNIVILPQQIETSARRWEQEGLLYNLVRNWILQIAYMWGVSPDTLSKWYHFR
ncbi:glycosyltransferase [candidate division KSB1 bacterium]|nr:glycosyltransferase [candidate division KSB1 bacterium]